MYAVVSKNRLDGGTNAFVKIPIGFTARETGPSLLQGTTSRSSEVRIHFCLREVAQRRDLNFFEIVDDHRGKFTSFCHYLRGFTGTPQWTAINGINSMFAQRCGGL